MPRKTILLLSGLITAVCFWTCVGTGGTQIDNTRGTSMSTEMIVYAQMEQAAGVNSVAFDSNGKLALSGSDDGIVRLWDLVKGKQPKIFRGHKAAVTSVSFSPNGKYALSGSNDKTVRLWDIESGLEIRKYPGHTAAVTSVCFSPSGMQVLAGSMDWTILLWDTENAHQIRSFQGHKAGVRSVAFNPKKGNQILSGSDDGTISLWDITKIPPVKNFPGHTGKVTSVSFSSAGTQVLSGSDDMTVRLWDLESRKEIGNYKWPYYSTAISSVGISSDGTQILSGSDYGPARLWDAASETFIRPFPAYGSTSAAFSPNGKQILTGSKDGSVELFDISTGSRIANFIGFKNGEWAVITSEGFYNTSPKGEQYIMVRDGGKSYGIDQRYSTAFSSSDYVADLLQGIPVHANISELREERRVAPENRSQAADKRSDLLVAESRQNQKKYALVIGNQNYTKFGRLTKTRNDADDMDVALRSMGFTVNKVLDGSLVQMQDALTLFKNRLGESKDAYGFFYYSGHGVQDRRGENYLIPADADIPSESYVSQRALSLETVLKEMSSAQNHLNIIVLDACRKFPDAWSKSITKGLAQASYRPTDSIIVYATTAGEVADEYSTTRNSLYTEHLLKHLTTPNLDVKEMFRRVNADVVRASARKQYPAIYDQYFDIAILNPRSRVEEGQ